MSSSIRNIVGDFFIAFAVAACCVILAPHAEFILITMPIAISSDFGTGAMFGNVVVSSCVTGLIFLVARCAHDLVYESALGDSLFSHSSLSN